MIYESLHTHVPGDNRRKQGGFIADWSPVDSNVDQFFPNFIDNRTDIVEHDTWVDELLNYVNSPIPSSVPISQPNNTFPTSIETPMGYGVVKLNQQGTLDVNHHNPMVSPRVIPVMSSRFHNSDSPINVGYTGYNSASVNMSNSQYFGGYSTKNAASTNMFNNRMSATQVFDGRSKTVTPGSVLRSVSAAHSSAQSFHQQNPCHQISYNAGFSMSANDVQPNFQRNPEATHLRGTAYGTHASNCGTFLQPQVYMPIPQRWWMCQPSVKSQSNGFKTPFVAAESTSHNCNDLNWNICVPAAFGMTSSNRKFQFGPLGNESWRGTDAVMESRKRKHHLESTSNYESWVGSGTDLMEFKKQKCQLELPNNYESLVGSGTLMDILSNSYLPDDLPPLEQWPSSSEDAPGPDGMGNGPDGKAGSSQPGPNESSGTLMDVYSSFIKSSACTKDARPNNEDALGPNGMGNGPDGKQDSSQPGPNDTFGSLRNAYSSFIKSSACTKDARPNNEDASGPDFMGNGPDEKEESSQPGPNETSDALMDVYSSFINSFASTEDTMFNSENALGPKVNKVPPELSCGEEVICGLNSALDDYASVLESMLSMEPVDLESEKTRTTVISVDHNGSEVETSNFKKPSLTLDDSFEDNGSEVKATNVKKPSVSLDDSFEDNGSGSGSRNIKKLSASLADSLTASQIKEHLSSFFQPKKEVSGSTTPSISQNLCQLCSKNKLLLAPTPVYCSSCDMRIKQNVKYYRSTDENTKTQHCICMGCFKGSRGSTIITRGGSVSKANLDMAKNDEEIEDSWVQCDTCQHWQHRICGLYNNETDLEGKAEYVCPKCCLKEIENGTRIPLPKTVLGAKDLPRTHLSDHIEQRLFTQMKQEREETAKFLGIASENVPEAEGLVVRVVVCVDKELEVKKQFRDIFQGQDYPEEVEYRSKLILLFQKIGGVDVCLFGMYVQEFGSECDGPNKRCIYISYIDSVKYFQPERQTASGEPLRTFVYHEILTGYMEYCKKRGFASCYIWSCPLIKGEDYIFYCHPKTQKTPEKTKLRQWYKSMIKKAVKDGIVVDQTNLYNQFFSPSNITISAARLPYFDGDCWSDAAENISKKLDGEESSGGKLCIKSRTKRILMADGQESLTKDALVMQNLGEIIQRDKENYMIVRLQHMCTSCNEAILSRSRWFCNQCNKIQLCSRCVSPNRMHKCGSCKYTPLSEDVLSYIPVDTKDKDDVIVNNLFENRDDFLNRCQNSLYQFDTLGHAKYSSMMILYHFKQNLVVQPKGT